MTERLLQYIWQYRHFQSAGLSTTDGQQIQVIQPGLYNENQGPDFLDAKMNIDGTIWAGHVELHTKSSDWLLHKHSNDDNYRNVILHVVWQHDRDCKLPFPTLELMHVVPKVLLHQHEILMNSNRFIPCENQLRGIEPVVAEKWKESLMLERLLQRALKIEAALVAGKFHWEDCFWHFLARNFGYPVNQDAFEKVAATLPINLLAKHKGRFIQLESLLLGQAGLLEKKFTDQYPLLLQKEFRFLQKKYGLKPIHLPIYFLRMRPANFPTIRLSQLAALINGNLQLFSQVRDISDYKEALQLFRVTANEYWDDHYMPDVSASCSPKNIGEQMIMNIFINTIIPFLFSYGYLNRQSYLKERALLWLELMAPEKNKVTKAFDDLGMANRNAFDSQALLHLKKTYCDQRRCLQCAIGNHILKRYERDV